MDQLKKALSGNKTAGHSQQPVGQKEDFGDKIFSAGLKKTGHGNIDRNTQEKITDGIRGAYEKATGITGTRASSGEDATAGDSVISGLEVNAVFDAAAVDDSVDTAVEADFADFAADVVDETGDEDTSDDIVDDTKDMDASDDVVHEAADETADEVCVDVDETADEVVEDEFESGVEDGFLALPVDLARVVGVDFILAVMVNSRTPVVLLIKSPPVLEDAVLLNLVLEAVVLLSSVLEDFALDSLVIGMMSAVFEFRVGMSAREMNVYAWKQRVGCSSGTRGWFLVKLLCTVWGFRPEKK
ncbi:uncharacterized protein BCR38DRAFT_474823 [Pseudomassariella vexata]|uniref:Uncharacterized protein n=1 Tax=Pseudomassariella vexata TaxID=1141098 RepID=A0A1Y2DYG0_9PEZI|nr:uncharacterized protein BCR38DRAFT_474823 [Pseudomassariella vexata]ORY64332.1 hypothetical protein BCR38DRAFT_474823 [Pseudomassariella vexata]